MFGNGRYPDVNLRLDAVVDMMREVSLQQDPQALVQVYGKRMGEFLNSDGFMSVSRRGLEAPAYRVTRASKWGYAFDPWRQRDKLPLLRGGVLADLIYSDRPHMMNVLRFPTDDPAAEFVPPDARLLVAVPHYDGGVALNYVFHFYRDPAAFDPENLPEMVWMSNLFGRGVNNLALSRDLRDALDALDRELKVVEEMQRSLLPQEVPTVPTLNLAAHYQTSRHAGGDYYDFFDLGGGLLGIFVADVSGHGTPAAVVMAVTHALAHNYPGNPNPAELLMHYLNQKLCASPTSAKGNFVTAFYGIYDSNTRRLTYSSAGHPEGRVLRAGGAIESLDGAKSLPLGIHDEERFTQAEIALAPGDRLCIFTDGITESFDPAGQMYGIDRLDAAISRGAGDPQAMINALLEDVGAFTGHPRGEDDRTIIAAVVT